MKAVDKEAFQLAIAGKWTEKFRISNATVYRVGTVVLMIKDGATKPTFSYTYENVTSSHKAFVFATKRKPLLISSTKQ
jgi:hypothetical protein